MFKSRKSKKQPGLDVKKVSSIAELRELAQSMGSIERAMEHANISAKDYLNLAAKAGELDDFFAELDELSYAKKMNARLARMKY